MNRRNRVRDIKKKNMTTRFASTILVLMLALTGCANKESVNTTKEVDITPELSKDSKEVKEQTIPTDCAKNWVEEVDDVMKQRVFEQDTSLHSSILDSSEVSSINVGTYVKTLNAFDIGTVSTNQGNEELVQLYWQCDGGDNPYEISWFHGSEWLVNVFTKEKQIMRYEIVPCNYNDVKTALGLAKLMQNGEDAVELAYNTYLDTAAKSSISKQEYTEEWQKVIANRGKYANNNTIYYGYRFTYSYPYVSILWEYDKGYVTGDYQFASDNSKAISCVLSSSVEQLAMDYVSIQSINEEPTVDGDTVSLKEIYKDTFKIGAAVPGQFLSSWGQYGQSIVEKDFNSITMENEMKPDFVLDQQESKNGVKSDQTYVAIKDEAFKKAADLFVEKGISVRYHTFVWHQQTPSWFFYEDYDTSKELVDAETMQSRMKNFISQMIDYFDENYPELLYTIDVVNEAFNGNGTYHTTDTKNYWYDILGYDYIYYAFLYSKEAINQSRNLKDVTLTYNDYGMPNKVDIVIDGLKNIFLEHGENVHDYIDVIGFQAHYDTTTSMKDVADAIQAFCEEGYEVQITELDIGIPDITSGSQPTKEQLKLQGEKFRSLMDRLLKLKEQGYSITAVTVWGLADDMSWRQGNDGKDACALLRGDKFIYKPAYYGMALDPSVLSYYELGIAY